MSEWIDCTERLPEPQQQVLVNDLNGEGVLIAWRALWTGMGGVPTGGWKWVFQIADLDDSDVDIKQWCPYPSPDQ